MRKLDANIAFPAAEALVVVAEDAGVEEAAAERSPAPTRTSRSPAKNFAAAMQPGGRDVERAGVSRRRISIS